MNLDKLQQWLQDSNNDLAYISNPITISYFTGYSMEPHERIFALIVLKDAEPFIFCPALNVEEAKLPHGMATLLATLIPKILGTS